MSNPILPVELIVKFQPINQPDCVIICATQSNQFVKVQANPKIADPAQPELNNEIKANVMRLQETTNYQVGVSILSCNEGPGTLH